MVYRFDSSHCLRPNLPLSPSLPRVSIFSKRSDGKCNGKPETENGKQKTGQFARFYISGFRFSIFHSFAGRLREGVAAILSTASTKEGARGRFDARLRTDNRLDQPLGRASRAC